MDLEEAFQIIEGVFVEYMDSRTFQRYLFDNTLLQLDGKAMSYQEYIKQGRKLAIGNKNTDYTKAKETNENLLEKFKNNNVTINKPL